MSSKKKKKKKELEQLEDELELDTLFDSLSKNDINEAKKDSFENELDHPEDILNQIDEENNHIFQREIDHPKDMRKSDEQKEKVIKEVEKVRKEIKKNQRQSNFLSTFLLFVTMVLEACYLGYNILYMAEEKNQLYLIINSIFLLIVTGSFGLGVFVKEEKNHRIMNVITSFLFVLFISFNILVTTNVIKLPTKSVVLDFRNQQVVKAMKWANSHNINLTTKYEYSDEFKTNTIMKQSVKPNTLTEKVKSMEIVVSNGPNYDLEVNIPDMIGWNVDEVVKIIKKNKLNNVTIDYEFKDDIKRDEEFEQSKSGKMKRSDELKLKFSLGSEADLKPVELKDLFNMDEFDATLWLKRNGIKYEIIYEYNDEIKKGNVIKTDPKKGTVIKQSEMTVKVYISKGEKIKAPDFTKMSLEEIEDWANQYQIEINYSSEYSSTVKNGNVIRASVKKNDIIEEGSTVYIVTSKGPLKMISYSDTDIDKIRTFASENGLQFVLNEEFHDSIEKGKIISVDKKTGQTLSQSETITVIVSLGKKKSIPNFIGMTKNEAKKACDNNGLSCTFNYAYSTKTKDTVIYQNKTAGSEVAEGTSITLTISNGKQSSSGGNSNSGGNSSSGGGSSSGDNTPSTPDPEPVCNSVTITIQSSLNGSSLNETAGNYRRAYPGIKFNFVPKSSNVGTNGMVHPDTASKRVLTGTTCDTFTIYVIQN